MSKTIYVPGQWNAICDICGRQYKSGEMRKNWKGQYVCLQDWEARHPQDFVRPLPDTKAPPWVRPLQVTFINFCQPNGITAIPGFAQPGCMIPGLIHPLFNPLAD